MGYSVPKVSFAGGEWSPSFHHRRDLPAHKTAVKWMENFIARLSGGFWTRPGLGYCASLEDMTKTARLIPFQYSATESYMLEFGDSTMRVIKDGGLVVETGAHATIIGPGSGTYKWTASAHAGFTDVYYLELNAGGDPSITKPGAMYQNANGVGGTEYTMVYNNYAFTLSAFALGEWGFGDFDSLGFETIYVRGHSSYGWGGSPSYPDPDGAAMGLGYPVSIATPYGATDLEPLRYSQSADVMILTHSSHGPRALTRSAHDVWTLTEITIASSAAAPTSPVGGAGSTESLKITTVLKTGEESVPTSAVTADSGESISWTGASGAWWYNIYKLHQGMYCWVGRVEGGTTSYTVDDTIPDVNKTPPLALNPFTAAGVPGASKSEAGYRPGCCAWFEQRLIFARSNYFPQSLWGSQIGFPYNMNAATPIRADDAFDFTLNSVQVNEIIHLVPLEDLIALTASSEWRISPGSQSDVITPYSVEAREQSRWGCDFTRPVVVGNVILFVQRGGRKVRALYYSAEHKSYASLDLSLFAGHLLDQGDWIEDMAFQQGPDPVLWCVTRLGKLYGLTFSAEQQIWGWHRHTTYGTGVFEAVAVLPDIAGAVDEVYFVVRRVLPSGTVRYIERMQYRFYEDTPSLANCRFLDAHITYDGFATTKITGLEHLDNLTVVAVADGKLVTGTVSDGGLELEEAASLVHIGLPFNAVLETMDLLYSQPGVGEPFLFLRQLNGVSLQIEDSYQVAVGPTEAKDDDTKLSPIALATDALTTGRVETPIKRFDPHASSVVIKTTGPWPLCVHMFAADMEVGEY